MPKVLHFFAENQPITHVIETLRALTIGTSIGNHSWLAVAWCVGVLVVSYALASELFKRKTTR
jgi:ABC-2 type transport system permease protein